MTDREPRRLWGGRFSGSTHPTIHGFTSSLGFDHRLARHDLVASLAHARMLWERGVLEKDDARALLEGLSALLREIEAGETRVEGEDEDVHSWIERTLAERIGEPADRLHTARSRNDQTAVALRLHVRAAALELLEALTDLEEAWLADAGSHVETWMPGYTHLQRAQPVSLAHHLLAHVWALEADASRLRRARREAGVSPLGAGALAGSSHPIDPGRTAALLGLERTAPNSLLAVADRDYVVETVFACALLMSHLSRWAAEVVLWSSAEFGFIRLEDSVAQGSSLLPQKKNPEAAELIRGKAGRVAGDVAALLTTLKGLPLAYDSDLQEDKEPLFDALDTARSSLGAAAVLARGIEYLPDRLEAATRGGHLVATELADRLVREGVPFRTAHERVGGAVRAAEERGCELWELPEEVLAACCPELSRATVEELRPEVVVRALTAEGGPAPERVRESLERARAAVEERRAWLAGLEPSPIYRAHLEGRLLEERLEA